MIQLPRRNGLFQTTKGVISASVYVIHPSVVIIGSVKSGQSKILPGHILIRNQALKKRSKAKAEWMHYTDLYSALRGMVHALRDGGAQPDVHDGEMQEFEVLPETLRRCSRLLFSTATYDEFIEQAAHEGIEYIIETLKGRQLGILSTAYADLIRSVQANDSLGRENRSASAMALGGAIHQLNKRDAGLRLIMGMLNTRVYRIAEVIYSTIDAYEALLESLGGREFNQYSEKAILVRVAHQETYSRSDIQRAKQVLEAHIKSFDCVYALPHVRNARHTQSDLKGMRVHLDILARHWDTQSAQALRGFIAVLRQGILWFLARHHLEIEIRAPLSWALGDRARERKMIRKAVHVSKQTVIDAVAEKTRARLAVIYARMQSYRKRLGSCPDDLLAHKLKQHSILQMNIAIGCARQDAWMETKARLKLVA